MLEEKKAFEMSDEQMKLVVGGSSEDERTVSNGACGQTVTLDFRGYCKSRTSACKCWYNVSGDA